MAGLESVLAGGRCPLSSAVTVAQITYQHIVSSEGKRNTLNSLKPSQMDSHGLKLYSGKLFQHFQTKFYILANTIDQAGFRLEGRTVFTYTG